MTAADATAGRFRPTKGHLMNMRCPKCGRECEPAGVVEAFGTRLDLNARAVVYQCDECVVERRMGQRSFPTALTFMADEAGRAVDPETLCVVDGPYARSAN